MDSKKLFLHKNIGSDNTNDVLVKSALAFHVNFDTNDLKDIKTFDELCSAIEHKIKSQTGGCTAQHAFYKLRDAIIASTGLERNAVSIQTCIKDILPKEDALNIITSVEKELGIDRDAAKQKAMSSLLNLVNRAQSGKILAKGLPKNLGQLAEKIAREHHMQCRRNPSASIRNEIIEKLMVLFQSDHEPSFFTPQTSF